MSALYGTHHLLFVCHRLLRDKVQALEDSVRAYHSIAEDMKMIPVTARNSRGENLVIELGMLYTSYTL